jgi:methionyl-tRNA formyltransferase
MSLHKISAEIDMGELVSTSVCYLEYKDTPGTLRKKLEQRIPDMLTDLYEYLKGNRHGKLIEEGIYRRRIEEKDYTINPETDTLLQVNAKIHSQAEYKGAIVECNGEKIYIKCWGDFEKVFGSNDAAVI